MTTAAFAKLEANAPEIARMLRVFANERRVRILCRLAASKEELPIAAGWRPPLTAEILRQFAGKFGGTNKIGFITN